MFLNYLKEGALYEQKFTVTSFREFKEKGKKISMLTAYDYPTAKILDESGVHAVLVGDSVGTVVLGYEDTIKVTMEDMIHHIKAVARGIKRAFWWGIYLFYLTIQVYMTV